MSINKTVLIWDTDSSRDIRAHETLILWKSYEENIAKNKISIPRLVEDNADALRSQYLSLIYELGESKIKDKRVIDLLENRRGFSYWWMTLLIEKCNYSKSPQIDNIIKLLAFNNWIEDRECSGITLVTSNSELASSIHGLTEKLDVKFVYKKIKSKKYQKGIVRRLYNSFPNLLKSIIYITFYSIERWSIKGVGVEKWKKSSATTTFISYFFNLDIEHYKKGLYKSEYWSKLTDLLEDNNVTSNWLHIYVKSEFAPTARAAKKIIEKFNETYKGKQNHVLLDSFLCLSVIWKTLFSWFGILVKYGRIERRIIKQAGYLWPLFKSDLSDSLVGTIAIQNLLSYYMFNNAMKLLPDQKKCFYLQENQGWEFGFISAWKKYGHGDLIGVQHTTVRYWDLRLYFDSRSYKSNGSCDLPLPKMVGVNGEVAKNNYIKGGYPVSDLVEVEALRYLQLKKVRKCSEQSHETMPVICSLHRVLVLGDYLQEKTDRQLQLLQKADSLVDSDIQYIVKPHPMCTIISKDYPDLNMIVTDSPIDKLIDGCSVAYTSSATAAAVDAYCAGVHVITIVDPSSLNLSPLKDREGVFFVSSHEELASILNHIKSIAKMEDQSDSFFYLDSELPRWKKLLVDNHVTENHDRLKEVK